MLVKEYTVSVAQDEFSPRDLLYNTVSILKNTVLETKKFGKRVDLMLKAFLSPTT